MKVLMRVLMIAMLVATLGLVGCGDDGNNGSDGASAYEIAVDNGYTGTQDQWLASLTAAANDVEPESCGACHNSVEEIHMAEDVATISNVTQKITGTDLEISFELFVDGMANDNFTVNRAVISYNDESQNATVGNPNPTNPITTLANGRFDDDVPVTATNGAYTATIDLDALAEAETNWDGKNAAFVLVFEDETGGSSEEPTVTATVGTTPLRDLVTNEACANCHGEFPAWSEKFQHFAVGGAECQTCHARLSRDTTIISEDANGDLIETEVADGSNFTEYIHGIHNSHNMPAGAYYRTTGSDLSDGSGTVFTIEDKYSVGYPSDMRNCAVCHEGDTRAEAAASAEVSYYLCMTCHQSWDSFDFPDGNFHLGAGPDTDCTSCHSVDSIDEAADFHNTSAAAADSYRTNFLYRGQDISFTNPDDVMVELGEVTVDGLNVSFTWTAMEDGAQVDPCNTVETAGPTFTQEMGVYLAYAKGDDWVNEFVGTSPGQPTGSDHVFDDLTTTCDGNTATTTGLVMNADALEYASKVLLAMGGKPRTQHEATGTFYYVRDPSPTLAFDPTDGSAADQRRDAVNNDKCLACHQGTLYQHGGDRVDNEQLCVVCHNPSANDKNVRIDEFAIVNADGTVNTDATYDGKVGETYDMRAMIHGIHGVAKREKPWTVYRGRGIYQFAAPAYDEVTVDGWGGPSEALVAIDSTLPEGWPTGAGQQPVFGSTNDEPETHNFHVVHYPQPANNCEACHDTGFYETADQTKSVALTVDPGMSWPDQSDDTVIGPTAAACTYCHDSADAKAHGVQMGYKAVVEKEDMIDKAEQ